MPRALSLTLLAVLALLLAVTPALAQGGPQTLQVDGFNFSYDAAYYTHVTVNHAPAEPLIPDAPAAAQPPHTQIMLDTKVGTGFPWEAPLTIRVYDLAEMAPYTFYVERVDALRNLLATRPDLSSTIAFTDNMNDNTLPFLPVVPAAQVMRAQPAYLDTSVVSGITYITTFGQAPEPFLSTSFMLTFQGLSADGTRYIAANMWLTTDQFPAEASPDFNIDTFIAGLTDYFNASAATLNAAPAASFSPSLDTLPALVNTFTFVTY